LPNLAKLFFRSIREGGYFKIRERVEKNQNKNMKKLIIFLLIIVGMVLIVFVFNQSSKKETNAPHKETEAQLPNPASVYCIEKEGALEIREDVDGNQKGFCVFDDGSECEEWKFFNNECEKGEFFCKDMCGDGICQEIVCEAVGCPCPENTENCPQDCF
jgi:putative hemolysin